MKVRCVNCKDQEEGDICHHCGSILPLPPGVDYYSVLGLERRAKLDEAALKHRFLELSKRYHPDRFPRADEALKEVVRQRTTAINNAYQALRTEHGRIAYLVAVETGDFEERNIGLSPELFDLVAEAQTAVARLKRLAPQGGGDTGDVAIALGDGAEGLRATIARVEAALEDQIAALQSHLDDLGRRWDALQAPDQAANPAQRASLLREMTEVFDNLVQRENALRRIRLNLSEAEQEL